jgi:hypothetical protein
MQHDFSATEDFMNDGFPVISFHRIIIEIIF